MENSFFLQAIIYLAAAVICVPIAKKIGLSSILGYLFSGIIIGPFVMGFIGSEGQDLMHFAEFGVVMMLFFNRIGIRPLQILENEALHLRHGIASGGSYLFGTFYLFFHYF